MTRDVGSELSFVNPGTFFKAPTIDLGTVTATDAPEPVDVGFLGIPYDNALGFRPGARFAPHAIRQATGRYVPGANGYYDYRTDTWSVTDAALVDAGDVSVLQLDHAGTRDRITAAARALRAAARLPIFIGGDHSCSYPVLRAFDNETFTVVQFDAHLDFTDERNGTKFSNSSPFRRAVEDVSGLEHIQTIGLRGVRFDHEAVEAAYRRGHDLVSADEVHYRFDGVLDSLPSRKQVYISIDVDALDPLELPGTSSPEPEGLTYRELRLMLERTFSENDVIGVDIMELAPNLDPSDRSSLLVARLLADILKLHWESPQA